MSNQHGMIDDLGLLRAFVAVVETGSFSEAGRRLGVVPSTISKQIAGLESRVSGQMVIRTTKGMSVTEIGQRFYNSCLTILEDVERAESEIGEYKSEPQGNLRLSAPTVFAKLHLMPMFLRFLEAYPKVSIEALLSTSTDDLIAKGIDVAVRISANLDPGLIQLKLAPNERIYCAAPHYLAAHGTPKLPKDIEHHNCIIGRGVDLQAARWPIRDETGEFQNVSVSGSFSTNNGELLMMAVLSGLGIGHLPRFLVQSHLDDGSLIEVFPESRLFAGDIYLVYPERRNLPLKTRVFLDFMKDQFKLPQTWSVPPEQRAGGSLTILNSESEDGH